MRITAATLLLLGAPVLRVLAFRHAVAPGAPPATCCPTCGADAATAAARADGCCGRCGTANGPPPYLVETLAVCALALLARADPTAIRALPALAWFTGTGVVLSFVDSAVRRLPDRLTAGAFGGTAALLAAAVLRGDAAARLFGALGTAGLLTAALLVLAWLRPGSLGPGDVKYAPAVGLVLGWYGWAALYAGVFTALALAAGYGLVRRARGGGSVIAFGPFLFAGALLGPVLAG